MFTEERIKRAAAVAALYQWASARGLEERAESSLPPVSGAGATKAAARPDDHGPPADLLIGLGRDAASDPYLRRFLFDLSNGKTVFPPIWAAPALLAWAQSEPGPVLRLFESGSANGSAVAAEALGRGWAHFDGVLLAACRNPEPAIRLAALGGLTAAASTGSVEATDAVIRMMHDRDGQVRWSAASCLGRARGAACVRRATAAFSDVIREGDERALVGAVFGLAGLWPVRKREAARLLGEAAQRSPLARRAVALVSRRLGRSAGLPLARSLATDSDPEVRALAAAAYALWATDSAAVLRALAHLADDADPLVRAAAAAGLAALPGDNGGLVERLASDPSSAVRAAVAEGLRRASAPACAGLLGLLARDPVPAVRAAAVRALAGTGEESALQNSPRDTHPSVRAAAAGALTPGTVGSLEALVRLAGDRDLAVARAAARALSAHVEKASGPGWERLLALCRQQPLASAAAEAAALVLGGDPEAGPMALWKWPASSETPTVLSRIALTATSWRIAETARTLTLALDPECEFAEAADDSALVFAAAGEDGIAELLLWLSALAQSRTLDKMAQVPLPAARPHSRPAQLLADAWETARRAARARRAEDRGLLLARATAVLGATLDQQPEDVEALCVHRAASMLRELLGQQAEGADTPELIAALLSRSVLTPGASVTIHLHNASDRCVTGVELAFDNGDSQAAVSALWPGESQEAEAPCHVADGRLAQVQGRALWSVEGHRRQTDFGGPVKVLRPNRLGPVANPFVVGKPLGDNTAMFFGRAAEIEFIERSVSADHGPVVVLVGPRRTGKTSLLQQVAVRLARLHRPVFLDMQGVHASHTDGFLRELARPLLSRGELLSDGGPGLPGSGADMVREAIAGSDQRVVLLLDEFDELERKTRSGALEASALDYLRHLVQHQPNVSLVLSGTHRLEELGGELCSFLLNLAIYRRVGCLNREEAEQVLAEPLGRLGIACEDAAVALGVRLTGGHPYFLQLLGYRIVERCARSGEGGVWVRSIEQAADEVVDQGDTHLRYLWDSVGDGGRPIVRSLAEANRSLSLDELREWAGAHPGQLDEVVERLVGLEIVSQRANRVSLRMGLLGRWLRLARHGAGA